MRHTVISPKGLPGQHETVKLLGNVRAIFCALIFLAVFADSALAQSNGAIVGTVKDPRGGVIVGATATITNTAEGVSKTTTSAEDGSFIFLEIPPGAYSVKVESAGFKTSEKNKVIVPVASKVNIGDVLLEVGAASDTITVEADAGQMQVQSESGERSDVVTNRQLRDIALNGRNVVDLMKTVPGVIAGGTQTTSTVNNVVGSFSINGTRERQHEYTIDGVTNLNLGNNTGALVTVNPDALQEVKVLTSNYQAEYGRAGGGVIALTTRSGTDDYHGGARYFRRHDSMNANTYFNNAKNAIVGFEQNPRPLYRFNYYGWDFGGPVFIPHVIHGKHKLFFFVSQEYYSQLVPRQSAVNIRVPTLLERGGDFSQSVDGTGKPIIITDPSTGKPFPGNKIPAGSIYAPGQAIINFLPTPNPQGAVGGNRYNYSSQVPDAYPRRETIIRGDWQINSGARLGVSWIHNRDDQQNAYGTTTASWNWPLTVTDRKNGPGNVSTLYLTNNFGPTLVNEFTFGSGRGGVTIAPATDAATRKVSGINTPLLFPDVNVSGLIPSLSFGGIANVAGTVNTSVFGTFAQEFTIWQVVDNITKVHGRHVFKFGLYFQRATNASNGMSHVESDIDFSANTSNPLNTGNPFANALLGIYNSYSQQSSKPFQNYLYHDVSWYGQDTWKILPRLTLDLGMRFSYYQPAYDAGQSAAFFDPAFFDPKQAPAIYRPVCVGATTCSSGKSNYRAQDPTNPAAPTLANTQPGYQVGRLVPGTGNLSNGLVTTPAAKNYPVSGLSVPAILYQPRLGFAWDVTGSHNTVVRGGFGITADRPETISFASTNPPIVLGPSLNFGRLQDITPGAGTLAPPQVSGYTRNSHFPMVYSYSIGVQRNIGAGTVLDVSYVGSQSRHNMRRFNLNAPAYGTAFTAGAQDPTQYANGVIPASEPALPSEYLAAGVKFAGDTILPSTDFFRPFQGYSDITIFQFDGNSTYHSLQVSASRRFLKSLTFSAAYNFSRTLTTVSDNGVYTNILDPHRFDYGLANFDRTHYFVTNFVWDLPKAGHFIRENRLVRALVDNWTLSGITWLSSGSPTELGLSVTGVDAGTRFLGTPTGGALSGQQPRFLLASTPQSGGTINPAAFTVPGILKIGPYPRAYLRNPGIHNQDLSIFKNFRFSESGTRYLQLRLEAFNVFNHPQFSGRNLATNITSATGATGANIFKDPNFTGLVATTNTRPAGSTKVLGTYFGEYTGARDPRILQIAAKFYF
ncbi:MAG: hypothetical protein NVS9B4_04630 [Candidatus Acidiferrum sp.]